MLMLGDKDGSGIWVINGTRKAQLNILSNRKLGVDDEALLQEHGIYYARRECNLLSSTTQKFDEVFRCRRAG
jgi:hypothetical protein